MEFVVKLDYTFVIGCMLNKAPSLSRRQTGQNRQVKSTARNR